ncbi:MAG: energy-coupling factor transporter ATPase [Bacillota bacterium]
MSIIVENVSYTYMPGTTFAVSALDNVSLTIQDGEFVGIIGPTGSGKSTLVQHLNGLLRPTSGRVIVDGIDLSAKRVDLKKVRRHVGVIFQYPEHQLFEETVYKDIAFGPKNLGVSDDEIERRVYEAIAQVGLGKEILGRSPFELSGGQMRRVAIAGVLAMKPTTLVLDEPAAGLDPQGRDEILSHVRDLHQQGNLTVILVSHSMEDVARLVSRVIVMDKGRIFLEGTPREVFRKKDDLKRIGLDVPQVVQLVQKLKDKGIDIRTDVLTIDEAKSEILRILRRSTQ